MRPRPRLRERSNGNCAPGTLLAVLTAMAASIRPLRLATITHFFPAHGGGLELVADKLVAEFAARGISIDWLSSATDAPPAPTTESVACFPITTTNVIERLTQLPYPLWSPLELPILWRSIGRADVVHVHEHLYFGSLVAVIMARLRHRPVVITQHMGALGLGSRSLTLLYEVAARLLGRAIFAAAARAVFISANVRTFFNRESSPTARLIFNGIDTDSFTAASAARRAALRARLGFPHDGKVVLFVGRFVRKKGFHIMEELTRRLPDLFWVFVGAGPENPARWGRKNVHVAGRVEHDTLPEYYQSADLLLLPSSGEGFPLVVQEALACGLGVLSTEEVGSACPAASAMIRTTKTPRGSCDIANWEQALRTAVADELYIEARNVRSHQSRKLWSWSGCAAEYVRLFEELTANIR
jgi:glycosyltransferase involved in cell wall biosynthesis